MTFTINDDFDVTGETLTVTEDVSFVGGTSVLADSTWDITGDLTASEGVTFATESFNGSTWTVSGTFTFDGIDDSPLDLSASEAWTLTVAGTGAASFVNVAYSDASGGSTIYATDSGDDQNNVNWEFATYTIQEAIRSILLDDATIAAARVYPNVVRQGRALPFIDYQVVSSETRHDLQGPIGITEDLINIHVFSFDYDESVTIGNAIEDALDTYRDTIEGLRILNVLILDSFDLPEPPADASDRWVFHRVIRIKTFSK